ncbi:RHS repeat-associated core domain-containing protein [Kordia sp.]|uniref:RHS repeat-associated core domain-containing protein n=1 Tax=Kordia sp. TaxID=1965332 RepID=UPI0025C3770A|nr:RHS repeat-associated core domain-containing protein [Kordia sp.]MCH2196977.1 RHS repeat-associated core domain-containing protein [Kordia sp.]
MYTKYKVLSFIMMLWSLLLSAQEQPPTPTNEQNTNWVSSISYKLDGQTAGKGVSFFNHLGKATETKRWDILTSKVWTTQTLYDYHGRSAVQTLNAPTGYGFERTTGFIKNNFGADYSRLDFDMASLSENPRSVSENSPLGSYYSTQNTTNLYQDITNYPFSRTVYSKMNPGAVKKVVGGNKINNEWKQGYSFVMPAGQELASAWAFADPSYNNKTIIKSVNRDIHGIETVVFTDTDGNTLAAARSGNEEGTVLNPINTTVEIKELGFVDIHIPVGCTGIAVQNLGGRTLNIYDLVTESLVTTTSSSASLSAGFYRIAIADLDSYVYDEYNPIRITHTVNYHDYTLNYYDKAGRVLKSTQPNGASLASTYSYNSLGQAQNTTSPDEGIASFKYRKDGQIRFSQNSKQAENNYFSYTNYDQLGRPVESGVYKGQDIPFNVDTSVNGNTTGITVTPINLQNVTISSFGGSTTYTKDAGYAYWQAGFNSQEQLLGDGKITFKINSASGNYVIVGLSDPSDNITTPSFTNMKYGIYAGNGSFYILENGDFIRNPDNTYVRYAMGLNTSDVLSVERVGNTVYYKRNDEVLRIAEHYYSGTLVVDASIRLDNNGFNDLKLYDYYSAESLVDAMDGLNDVYCEEQHFTLYDVPDADLVQRLSECGISQRGYTQTYLAGNVSKTYTKNPETATTWYSYDQYGRVKWIIQDIEGLDCPKTIQYEYDNITGQVVKVDYQSHQDSERFIHKYTYNDAGQLTIVHTGTPNDGAFTQTGGSITYKEQARYIYNETGQVVRVELAENLQGIDYVYNLAGQLKAINSANLSPSSDPGNDGNNGFVADVFGMQIDYYNGDYLRTGTPTPVAATGINATDQFNGNIKAAQWNTQGNSVGGYAYNYNKNQWLTGADFQGSNTDYDVSNLTYDANGNIQTLKRNGYTDGTGTNSMDNFTYHYKAGTNQLVAVEDQGDNTDVNRYDDLKNQYIGSSEADANYVYNSIGQLVVNKQDKISYEYNAAGLVTKINSFSNQNTQQFYTIFNKDYENALQVNANDWIVTDGSVRVSFANNSDQIDQGNVIILQTNDIIPTYCTDFDGDNNLYHNRLQFNFNTNPAVAPNPYMASTSFRTMINTYHSLDFDLFVLQEQVGKMINGSHIKTPIAATAIVRLKQEDGTLIQEITISPNNIMYCNRHLEQVHFEFVATGEKIYLEIDVDNNGTQTSSIVGIGQSRPLYQSFEIDNLHLQAAMKPALAFYYNDLGYRVRKESYDNFGNVFKTIYVRDVVGNPIAIYRQYNGQGGALALKEQPVYGASRLGVFYRDNSLEDKGTYAYQLTDHLGNVRAVIMKDGNNALSLTNKTDYYPFGMPMPDRNITDGNYRYAYQGQEKDPETGKEAFQLRLWDSRIGRWLTVDPKNEFHSPYLGMGNNPISLIDPDGGSTIGGGCPDPPCSDNSYLPEGYDTTIVNDVNPVEIDVGVFLPAVHITAERKSSSSWFTKAVGHTIVFVITAWGTLANNNTTFGTYELTDAADFGEYELSARFGKLAGNALGIWQAGFEYIGAGGSFALSGGGSAPVSAPVTVHATAVGTASIYGTASEISGLVNYFSRNNNHSSGGDKGNYKRLSSNKKANEYSRERGYKDAHELKDYHGADSKWDIFVDSKTGKGQLRLKQNESVIMEIFDKP